MRPEVIGEQEVTIIIYRKEKKRYLSMVW